MCFFTLPTISTARNAGIYSFPHLALRSPPQKPLQAGCRLNIETALCTLCRKHSELLLPHLTSQLQLTYCPKYHCKAKDNNASREGIAAGCHTLFALLQSPFPRCGTSCLLYSYLKAGARWTDGRTLLFGDKGLQGPVRLSLALLGTYPDVVT